MWQFIGIPHTIPVVSYNDLDVVVIVVLIEQIFFFFFIVFPPFVDEVGADAIFLSNLFVWVCLAYKPWLKVLLADLM